MGNSCQLRGIDALQSHLILLANLRYCQNQDECLQTVTYDVLSNEDLRILTERAQYSNAVLSCYTKEILGYLLPTTELGLLQGTVAFPSKYPDFPEAGARICEKQTRSRHMRVVTRLQRI